MSPARMTMMAEDDIRTEIGWNGDMIHSLLQNPDSPHARRNKHTGGYTYGLYKRDRVLAIAQSTEGRAAKRRRDETYVATHPTLSGRHDSAIWDACCYSRGGSGC
jgi:hypothetical protein